MKTLFIADLDGTFLRNDRTVSEFSKNTINDFMKNGGYFSVATARSPATAVPILNGINFNAPAVLMNGVFIFDIVNNKSIKTFSMTKQQACDVI
ncbi:MAG: HAD family hydrolase, partial [Clostridiales bacterium]|nr:HAD family hydrolase [Clostridiales bacterium]